MLLAVDSSTTMVGLALYDGSQVIGEMVWQTQNHHTVELAPAVQTLLTRSGVSMNQLTVLAVALGPGSFTSLRIGLSLVKGMAFALRLPVIGIPTLDILAAAQPVQDYPLAAVLQAGRGRLAVGWYSAGADHWVSREPAQVCTLEELAQRIRRPTLVCGELNEEERRTLARKRKNVLLVSPAGSLRSPCYLAELAWERWQAGQTDNPVTLAPIYLHMAEAVPA